MKLKMRGALSWASYRLGALSGDRAEHQDEFRLLWARINQGHYPHNTTAFRINVEAPNSYEWKQYETIWIKTSNGAYTVVKTLTVDPPAMLDKKAEAKVPEPAYVLLFSPDPSVLGKCFLTNKDGFAHFSPEASSHIFVVSARRERDIAINGDVPRSERQKKRHRLDFNWVRRHINQHSVQFDKSLRRHGIMLRDGDTWRSASSAFWLEPVKNENLGTEAEERFNVFYYANPIHTEDGFLGNGSLEDPDFRTYLSRLSVNISPHPLPRYEAEERVRNAFTQCSRAIMRGEDPYITARTFISEPSPDGKNSIKADLSDRVSQYSTVFKAKLSRGMQTLVSRAANIDRRNFLFTILSSAVIFIAINIPVFVGLIASTRGNSVVSMTSKIWKDVTRFILPVENVRTRPDRDIAERFAQPTNNDFVLDTRLFHLNAQLIPFMRSVDATMFDEAFPNLVPFDDAYSRQWACSILYDTLGCHAGTEFSHVRYRGRMWLQALQPNGLRVRYNTRYDVALADTYCSVRQGSVIEKPVKALMSEIPDDRSIMGVHRAGQKFDTFSLNEGDKLPVFAEASPDMLYDRTPEINPYSYASHIPQLQGGHDWRQNGAYIQELRFGKAGFALKAFLESAEPMQSTEYQLSDQTHIMPIPHAARISRQEPNFLHTNTTKPIATPKVCVPA